MSTVFDVRQISATGADDVSFSTVTSVPLINLSVPNTISSIAINVPGPQGPRGVQNVFVSSANPAVANGWGPAESGYIWIEVPA